MTIPLLPDLPFEGTPSVGCSFFESLADPLWKKRDCFPSRSFGNHHSKRTWVDSQEVEDRSKLSSTWGGDYMPELILVTRPSSAQQKQGSFSPPSRTDPDDGTAAGSSKSTQDNTSSDSGSSRGNMADSDLDTASGDCLSCSDTDRVSVWTT